MSAGGSCARDGSGELMPGLEEPVMIPRGPRRVR